METPNKLVLFILDEQRYALDLTVVERGIRVVEIIPVPQAPLLVLGVINMSGRIIPVLDTRSLLGLAAKEVGPDDHLLIAQATGFKVSLLVDEISGVINFTPRMFSASGDIFPGIGEVQGVVRLEEDIIFIYDFQRFLFRDDWPTLGKEAGHTITTTEQMVENV